jgi:NAD(P)-dependent dehydrogenase (short-subunit alcohol dehydrogenase family)
MRLQDKVAIVVGAGQSPGEGMGNGRATALTFAREGAKVLCVDHHLESAQETVDLIAAKQGTAAAFKADVTKSADIKAMVAGAASTCCTTMSASASPAATPNCWRSPRKRSTASSPSI